MDPVAQETTFNVVKYLGGGWVSVAVSAILVFGLTYLRQVFKKAQLENAKKGTALSSVEAKANLPEENRETQGALNEAEKEAEAFKARMQKENPHD